MLSRDRKPVMRPFHGQAVWLGVLAVFLLVVSIPTTLMAAPIGLMERFALAEDREAILAELIPGTEDYFFYHCLHYQNTGQLDRAEAILKDWGAWHQGEGKPFMTPLMHSMMDRQRLLSYDQSPQQTIDHFVKRLGIELSHAPPAQKGARRYPSELAEDFIDPQQVVQQSLRDNTPLSPLGMQVAADMYRGGGRIPGVSLETFLGRVDGPYLEGLGELVIAELKSRTPRDQRFGDLPAHEFLTLGELEQVARAIPAVGDDNALVYARLHRLRPGGDVDVSQQPEVRRDYLTRVETYVRTLPASYNSLKASSAYRLLEANLSAGIWDRELFLRYLALPRQSPIISPIIARGAAQANLREDFTDVALLPPIVNEQPLVETYLEHFLRDARDTSAFDRFLKPDYLRRVFARTKLLAGVANPQPYFEMLSAAERRALRDQVQLSFAPINPIRYDAGQPTELIADIKNIDDLVVRVYEMNALSFYRTHNGQLDSDVELDGLVATHERNVTFDRPAIERHRETIPIPEASGRGVWIVDLVGKGLRARTIIRRGDLQTVRSRDANGMRVTVIDENREVIPSAKIYVGNQEFTADESGVIVLPMVNQAVDRKAIVSDGAVAEPLEFRQPEENYQLLAGFFVDHTLLQTGRTSTLLVRPQLRLNDQPVDPSILKDAGVRVVATDLDGIETTKQFDDLELDQSRELSLEFRVPPRVAKLSFQLTGHVIGLSDDRRRELQASHTVDVATIRRTSQIVDAFLTRDGGAYVIETRGRTGEPVPAAAVNLQFQLHLGDFEPNKVLQSDDQGRIRLGPMTHVRRLRYGAAGQLQHTFDLTIDRQVWPSAVHLSTEDDLRLPLIDGASATDFRLLEMRLGKVHSDLSAGLKLENGFLVASDLPAGDFWLVDRRTGERTRVAVVDGRVINDVVVGEIRHREQSLAKPLSIGEVDRTADGSLQVQLTGVTDGARVHVIATRYFDRIHPLDRLHLPMPALRGRQVSLNRCGYVSDLRLGDEYEYVLRRQYAAKYPGVMLPQPSVLLNPWETETTTNQAQTARAGEAPAPSAAPRPESAMEADRADRKRNAGGDLGSDYDFLSDSGALASGLQPDREGRVTIPADLIAGMPIVQLVVADPATVLCQTVTSATTEVQTEDLRLAESLPLNKSLSFERTVSIVSGDNPLDLAELGSAQVQVYGNVASLLTLYRTLVGDPRLDEFQVLGRWHTLSESEKLRHYSELTCHELHLFLRMHDRKFFDAVIQPYLANKKEKQFIDHWLLGDDLTPYTTLWQYRRLSAAERALLALRFAEVRPMVRRDLGEILATMDADHEQSRRRIETALRFSRMSLPGLADKQMDELAEAEAADARMLGESADAFGMGFAGGMGGMPGKAAGSAAAEGQSQRMNRRGVARQFSRQAGQAAKAAPLFQGRSPQAALRSQRFYQQLDSTKQYAESQFDRVRVVGGPAPLELIPVNAFWNELAGAPWEDATAMPPVSEHLLDCTESRHAALIALAMCGLPLESGNIGLPTRPETLYRPEHPVALVTKRLRELSPGEEASSVLIGQLFRPVSVAPSDGAAERDADQFVTGEAYRGQLVVSNPTADEQTVELFWQLPAGSLPLAGSQVTDSKTVKLAPFAVASVQYEFYFPAAGEFQHYPATVSNGDTLLAKADNKTFRVAEQWENDEVTWRSIARDGSPERIRTYLNEANLHQLDWSLILHRLRDAQVYRVVVDAVLQARLDQPLVLAYGFHHNDRDAMRQYLSLNRDLVQRSGPALSSPLLDVDAIDRGLHEHLEYAPLVRARIHRLGEVDEIFNPKLLQQYQSFVRYLGFQPAISDTETLPLVYYLLLQNRIEEAITFFGNVQRDRVATDLQYDYLAGYLALHQGEYERALQIAREHENHPVPRWKLRFGEMADHVAQRFELMDSRQLASVDDAAADQPAGVSPQAADLAIADRDRANSQASAAVPEVMARIEGDSIRIDHRNTRNVEIKLYGVDLELLFSKAPFAREDLQRIAMVRPTYAEQLSLTSETGTLRFPVPQDLRSRTLLVEATAGASRNTTLYYGGELTTYVSEAFGQLQTTDAATHRPIAGAYVKVYARYPDGEVKFFKDGYTDGRGRFDYSSISAADAKGAQRFAILVLSEQRGATLHDVAAP
jgi:hypothetical protein